MTSFDILNEPVRGLVPPDWFMGLSGIDRIRAWSSETLPGPPVTRLMGSRCTHVVPGSAVCVMAPTDMLAGPNGNVQYIPIAVDALNCAMMTSAGPDQTIKMLSMSIFNFRPARVGMGTILARARVVNASSLFAYAEVTVEDSEGRQLAHCGGQAALVALDPAPPPPSPFPRIEQPVWATPDPWQRPPGPKVATSVWEATDGIEGLRALSSGSWRTPTLTLFGMQLQAISDGRLTAAVPASPWFRGKSRQVAPGMIANFINMACWFSGFTLHRAGNSFAGLDDHVRFFRQPVADGRPMRLEANSVRGDGDQFIHEAVLYDADNNLVARGNVMAVMIDNKRRKRQQQRVAERALCTILFTDIVDSTRAAGALGDKAWNALLEQHNDIARREIARCTGTVVKNTGDGLLARFATPAQGLDCAVRLRDALSGLGISIRAGLHMGECEIVDDDIIGTAVNLASRIQAAALPGEVYVSSTVRDLVSGSATRFESRGEHQLKGFEEPWRLWSVK